METSDLEGFGNLQGLIWKLFCSHSLTSISENSIPLSKIKINAEVRNYLISFYKYVENELSLSKWDIVKTVGDSILVNCNSVLDAKLENAIKSLYLRLSKKFDIRIIYRECEIETAYLRFGSFQCKDVFGKDVFLKMNFVMN